MLILIWKLRIVPKKKNIEITSMHEFSQQLFIYCYLVTFINPINNHETYQRISQNRSLARLGSRRKACPTMGQKVGWAHELSPLDPKAQKEQDILR